MSAKLTFQYRKKILACLERPFPHLNDLRLNNLSKIVRVAVTDISKFRPDIEK